MIAHILNGILPDGAVCATYIERDMAVGEICAGEGLRLGEVQFCAECALLHTFPYSPKW